MTRLSLTIALALLVSGCASTAWQDFKKGMAESARTPSKLVHIYTSDDERCYTWQKGERLHTICN